MHARAHTHTRDHRDEAFAWVLSQWDHCADDSETPWRKGGASALLLSPSPHGKSPHNQVFRMRLMRSSVRAGQGVYGENTRTSPQPSPTLQPTMLRTVQADIMALQLRLYTMHYIFIILIMRMTINNIKTRFTIFSSSVHYPDLLKPPSSDL